MTKFKDQVVWITGGGSGIGKALAAEFVKKGAKVAVSGRRVEKLEEVVSELGDGVMAVPCDVTKASQIQKAVEQVLAKWGRLDVAIANAGFGVGGRIEDLTQEEWRRQFDVNVVGLAQTAKYALPHLRKTQGRMVLVGSVAGTIAMPGIGAYHSSKYAVRAIGQTLSMELQGSGVSCTTIQPGFVESEIGQVDNTGQYQEGWSDKRPKAVMWTGERAAKVCLRAIAERRREFTFTGHGKLMAFVGKHTPGLAYRVLERVVKPKKGY